MKSKKFKIGQTTLTSLAELKPSYDGEIAYCQDSQCVYIFSNNQWKLLENIKEIINIEEKQQLYPFICERCGAPVNFSNKCEYCGTIYK